MSFKRIISGDKVIWMIVVLLSLISIIGVFSTGSYLSREYDDGLGKLNMVLEQGRSVLLGFAALFACYFFKIRWYRVISPFTFILCVIMLLMLFTPLKDIKNGAVRGIKLFGYTIQIFEFAKVGMVLYLAWALERFKNELDTFKDFFIKIVLWIGLVSLLVIRGSFSSTILIATTCFAVLFFMEVKFKHLMLTVSICVGLVGTVVASYNIIKAINPDSVLLNNGIYDRVGTFQGRITAFKDKSKTEEIDESKMTKEQLDKIDREERQASNAKIAIHEGGLIGKGPGNGTQRYSLTHAYSDFIFASLVEELGLFGGIVIILLYLLLLFRCITIAYRCRTPYTQALVLGLGFLITLQAFLHILVNVGLFPVTGQTLPLVSHGGTAYLVFGGAMGIILAVSRSVDEQEEREVLEKLAKADEAEEVELTEDEYYEH